MLTPNLEFMYVKLLRRMQVLRASGTCMKDLVSERLTSSTNLSLSLQIYKVSEKLQASKKCDWSFFFLLL
jgi:hypothetical protein